MIRALFALLLIATPLAATETVVLGMSQNRVAITANFDGSEILIFGAVKRDGGIPDEKLDVIVTVAAPDTHVTVRKKEKRFGIWVNTEAIEVDAAPPFYAIATSAPWDGLIHETEDLRHSISIPKAIRAVGNADLVDDVPAFTEALIRIRTSQDRYQLLEGAVAVDEETLFRTAIALPANLTEGRYTTRVFLVRGKEVVADFATGLDVQKVGLERWLFSMSREMPLIYGLMSLAIAIAAGWLASAFFRFIRF